MDRTNVPKQSSGPSGNAQDSVASDSAVPKTATQCAPTENVAPKRNTDNYKFLPLSEALQVMCFPVLVEMVRSAAEGRCIVCGWPLAPTVHRGCVPGNCSFRPDESSREYSRWRQRTEIVLYALAGEVTNPAPRDPAGDCAREFAEANGAPARTGEPGSAQWAGAEEKSSNAEDVRNAATGEL